MAQFKIRNGYVFVDAKLNPRPAMKVVDDSHPMFASQIHKFETEPIEPAEAEKIAAADDAAQRTTDDLGTKTRKELLSMYRSVFGHKAPDGHPVSKLRADIQRALDGEISTDPEDGDTPKDPEEPAEDADDADAKKEPEDEDDGSTLTEDSPAVMAGHVKPSKKK